MTIDPLTNAAVRLLQEATEGRSPGDPLFATEAGQPMTPSAVARVAQSKGGVSVHSFRYREKFTAERVPMGALRVGDVIYLGGADEMKDGTLRGLGDALPVYSCDFTGPGKLPTESRTSEFVIVTVNGGSEKGLTGIGSVQVAIVARHHLHD